MECIYCSFEKIVKCCVFDECMNYIEKDVDFLSGKYEINGSLIVPKKKTDIGIIFVAGPN